jgi:hypothetical protein
MKHEWGEDECMVAKPERKSQLGRTIRRLVDNIKENFSAVQTGLIWLRIGTSKRLL